MPAMFDMAVKRKTVRFYLDKRVEEFRENARRGYCHELARARIKDTIAPAIKDLKDSQGLSWDEATDLYEMYMRMGLVNNPFMAPFDEEDLNEQQREIRTYKGEEA